MMSRQLVALLILAMRLFLLLVLLFSLLGLASPLASAQRAPLVLLDASAIAQSYTTGDGTVAQVTLPLAASVRISKAIEVAYRTAFATASGDDLEMVSGLTDTQIGARFSQPIGGGIVDLSLTASLPTGQTALTLTELATASTLSLDDYAFATPSFGRGTVLLPGVSVALPLSETAAVGVGAVYSIASDYTLVALDPASYGPGNEMLLTAGLDAALGRAGLVSIEGSYTRYGDDTYREATYSPGSKLGGAVRLSLGTGTLRTRMLASVRRVTNGTFRVPEAALRVNVPYTRPTQGVLAFGIDSVQPRFDVSLTGRLRYYGSEDSESTSETAPIAALADQQVLLDAGIASSLRLSPTLRLRGGFTTTRAIGEDAEELPFSGTRVRVGLRVGF